jgi:hypothetical protein
MKARFYIDEQNKGKVHIIVEPDGRVEDLAMQQIRQQYNSGYCEVQIDVSGFGMFLPWDEISKRQREANRE